MTTAIHPAPVLRAAGKGDRDALAEMFSGLSSNSSFQRFFSGGFRPTDKALDQLLCLTGIGRAFVAVEEHRVVAHAMWATSRRHAERAEIAFVVAADRRGQGLAARLTSLVLADAAECGIVRAEATVLATNHAAHRLVRRLLPHAISTSGHGEVVYAATLSVSCAAS